MSQGGSEVTRAFLDAIGLLMKVVEMVMKVYENKNDKKELEALKKDKDSIIARKCGAFRGVMNKFYEKNFEGEWKEQENPATGQMQRVFAVKKTSSGIPVLKRGGQLQQNMLGLIKNAQAMSKDGNVNSLLDNFQSQFDTYLQNQLVPMYKEELKATGNKELANFADSIKDESNITQILEGVKQKANEMIKSNDSLNNKNAEDFLHKSDQEHEK